MFKVGELDQLVTIKRRVRTPDGGGGFTSSLNTVGTEWARVRPMSGNERLAADKIEAPANYAVIMRTRSDLLESDILEWGSERLNIRFIAYEAREPFMKVECQKGVAT